MKTIATYKSNGKYNPTTDRVDYQVTTKEIEVKWESSIEIDGKETTAIRLFPEIINDVIEDVKIIFKLSENEYVVHDSMCTYSGNNHRNDFSSLKESLEFVDSLVKFDKEFNNEKN